MEFRLLDGRKPDQTRRDLDTEDRMCFSATGSFVVSGALTAIGSVSLARNSSKPHRLFAAIPLLFAAQQACEGVVWLTIGDASHAVVQRIAVNAFLAFALVVWPTWLPSSLAIIERDAARRRSLVVLAWFGAVVSLYAAVILLRWEPTARIAGRSLAYDYRERDDIPIHLLYLIGYVVPTVVPFFVSRASLARTLGVMLVVSLLATFIVRRDTLTSVWCFFAALLSVLVVASIARETRIATELGLRARTRIAIADSGV